MCVKNYFVNDIDILKDKCLYYVYKLKNEQGGQ